MKSSISTILLLLLFHTLPTNAQSCYTRLADASGIDTEPYQQGLEAAACSLRAVFPTEFQQSFKVYDVGFYLHNTVTTGYPQIFEIARNDVSVLSPYYLLFGKQTDRNGIYTKFWVDLKLPTTGKFGCIDLLSPTLRGDINKKIEYVTTTTYENDGGQFFQYAQAEKAAMEALQKIVADFVECCDLQARNNESTSVCNAFLFPASLTEVTFSDTNYIEMKRDGDSNFGQPFPKPHYLNTRPSNQQSPLAHVGGCDVSALAKFAGNENYDTIKVRGKGEIKVNGVDITVDFAERTAEQDAVTKQITANMVGTLPSKVLYLDDFTIKWEIKVKKAGESEGGWEPVGECVNDWYLTLRQPKEEKPAVGYLHFHTLFDISCRHGIGETEDQLIKGVWEHFVGRQVKRADGQPMKYYGQWSGGNLATNTSELLQRKDGMCMAWTRILLDVLKVQGFSEKGNFIVVKPRSSQYMLVKTWKKTVNIGTSQNFEYPFKNEENNPIYVNNSYKWLLSEVLLNASLPSQNNSNPQSDFGNHVIAKIKGKLYDPSYGTYYGLTEKIKDPLDPLEMVDAVSEMNKNISAYTIKPFSDRIHYIQINDDFNLGDIIVVDTSQTATH